MWSPRCFSTFFTGSSVTIEVTSSGAMGGDDEYEIEEDPELLMAVYDALHTSDGGGRG